MKKLWEYIKPYLPRMSGGFAIKFTGAIMDLLIPWMLSTIIDDVIPTGDMGRVLIWGGLMILAAGAVYAFNVIPNRMAAHVARDITEEVRRDLYSKTSSLSCAQVDRLTIPSLISRITSDTYNIHRMLNMIQRLGVDFPNLPDEQFDSLMGESTGAAVIFGATGGVMEAALRTAVEKITGQAGGPLEFTEVRGTQGVKEASYTVGGLTVNVAVCSGLANARKVLESVKSGEKNYHFIEVMACPGGCVNGGGQPIQPASVRNFVDLKALRAGALYRNDTAKTLRRSHENPDVIKIYDEYLGQPGGHRAHEILHTTYVARKKY